MKNIVLVLVLALSIFQSACSSRTAMISTAVAVGAGVGAAGGYAFIHHGERKQYQTRNTIISSVVLGLIAGGLMAWHFRVLEQEEVRISGKFANYRLCDPERIQGLPLRVDPLDTSADSFVPTVEQVRDNAVTLDENTRWMLPIFRKRYLPPEREGDRLVSSRYTWEVVKEGFFISRELYPDQFGSQKGYQINVEGTDTKDKK